jgi:Transposase IS116/IS110/IS902 family
VNSSAGGGADHRYIPLLVTAPGFGPINAFTVASEIGDIARFSSPAKLCGYTGLCPRVIQSGSSDRHGPISKHGPRYLRWGLFEAAMNACKQVRAVRSDVVGVGDARCPHCRHSLRAGDREIRNATTRDVHAAGERRHAALDEFAALISGAWQGSTRVVSASVCAIGDNRGPCFLWQGSLMLRDWRLRSPAP